MKNDNKWINPFHEDFKTKINNDQWIYVFDWLIELNNDYNRFTSEYNKLYKENIECPPYIFLLTILQLFLLYSSKNIIEKLDQIQYYLFACYTLCASLFNDIDYLQRKEFLYQFIVNGSWLRSKYSDVRKIFKLQKDIMIFFDYDFFNIQITSYFLINFKKYFDKSNISDHEIDNYIEIFIESELEKIYNKQPWIILQNDPYQLLKIIVDNINKIY
jgi:hypothetical protein